MSDTPTPEERITLSIELTFNIDRLRALDPDFTAFLQEQLDQLMTILRGQGALPGGQAMVVEQHQPSAGIDLTQQQFPGMRVTG